MAGRHSIATRHRARMLEMADVRSPVIHLLTPDALNAGRQTPGDYIAVCGTTVIPAPDGRAQGRLLPQLPPRDPHSAGQGCTMSPHVAGAA